MESLSDSRMKHIHWNKMKSSEWLMLRQGAVRFPSQCIILTSKTKPRQILTHSDGQSLPVSLPSNITINTDGIEFLLPSETGNYYLLSSIFLLTPEFNRKAEKQEMIMTIKKKYWPTGNQRPVSRRWVFSSLQLTPGSTRQSKSCSLISKIRFIFMTSKQIPPCVSRQENKYLVIVSQEEIRIITDHHSIDSTLQPSSGSERNEWNLVMIAKSCHCLHMFSILGKHNCFWRHRSVWYKLITHVSITRRHQQMKWRLM